MKNIITKMSYHMEHLLKLSHYGNVHSVYRKTINLEFNGKLAALQANDSPLSPISLITALTPADMEALNITKGDLVTLKENCLEITPANAPNTKPYLFSYIHAEKYDLRLPGSLSKQDYIKLAQNIHAVLSLNGRGGFQPLFYDSTNDDISALSLTLLAAKRRMDACTDFYYNKNYSEAALELSRLLGLGSGLTPSGDDFLCGVLAGLRLAGINDCEFDKTMKSEIKEHLDDTIDISATFLSCAIAGQYSLAVNRLYNMAGINEIFSDFSAIGHSSGMDTLCGVLYALELAGQMN